uniref:NAC domain-containing protein n=1 Tax=Daucus carota subsp. sativus TaxID=79200 RepID=A0A164VT84_DAUCS
MEKNCIVGRNGEELQLPVGFRFRPTDEELILYYLMPKAQSLPLPAAFIPQIDEIFQSHPSHLPGDVEQRRYYFCKRSWDYSKTCRSRINYISNESSYWKQAGKERAISVDVAHRRSIVVGTKKLFDFDNWVAYRVYQRKRNGRVKNTRENTKKMDVAEGVEMMSINNATEVESSPLPSPLCSSNDEETFL